MDATTRDGRGRDRHAGESGVAEQLAVIVGDAYSLPFRQDWFDLVVVIRVVAWLRDPDRALG